MTKRTLKFTIGIGLWFVSIVGLKCATNFVSEQFLFSINQRESYAKDILENAIPKCFFELSKLYEYLVFK